MYVRLSAGRCESCDRLLSDVEMHTKGVISHQELGLCHRCSHEVNDWLLALYNDKEDMPKEDRSKVCQFTEEQISDAVKQHLHRKV